ncbi:MAG: saccharopine dehydrogenase NADP-binding domain-containing protein [Anaerolineae bacterium]|nr:saccharopine dehydrogenase NADP-binding domain-containing protein [Anaerolineae bacterium]
MSKLFDIVLWGATGFTGQLVAEYLAQNVGDSVRWAIAGRNQEKLEKLRESLAIPNLPILIGDSHDQQSMDAIVAQTRVVCSTVGPYTLYGTPLVAACAAQGVDYCDLTGETLWMRQIIDTYQAQAEQSGARIVHCCGYDSIPSDLGTLVLQEHAQAVYGRSCHEVQYISWAASGGFSGGTIASLLNVLEETKGNKTKAKLMANPYNLVPEREPDWSQTDQDSARYDEATRVWTGPFMMASINSRIVRRSNALLGWRYGEDFRYNESMKMPNRAAATAFSASYKLGIGAMMALPVRGLVDKALPSPGEGPSVEIREKGFFKSKLVGKTTPSTSSGTTSTSSGTTSTDSGTTSTGSVTLIGEVSDNLDPGYGSTAKMLGESALCLAFDDIPQRGGILTPASAMGMTLVNRLRQAGMTFKPET